MSKKPQSLAPFRSDFLFYAAPDGTVKVQVLFRDETAWLPQKSLAGLFGVKVPAIAKHLKNIYESGELERGATVSKMEIVQSEGDREVAREIEFYNLDAIIAVGYRVNSYQATQFRIWATSFFKAAATLFRAKPWKLVPDDQSLFSVTIEQLGMRDAAMSVIGQAGQSFGLVLFSGIEDFEAYLDAAEVMEAGEEPEMPPHFTMNFERGAELAPELRKEISEHHWEVAGANAYPWLMAIDEDLVARPPTGKEVTMAESIALALTKVMAEKKALRKAWDGGEPVVRTLSVTTHAGEVEVMLCTSYMRAPVKLDPSHDIVADLASLKFAAVCDPTFDAAGAGVYPRCSLGG